MNHRYLLTTIAISFATALANASAREIVVPLVNYYSYAPFSMPDENSDLTRELASLLTADSGGRYRFVPSLIPKGRLDIMMQHDNWQGVVVWLNPRFVNDESKLRYIWSNPLMQESDLVLSHIDAPVEFTGLASLKGKVLGTVLNQRYADVEEMLANGELHRSDAPSQENSLRKLLLKRVDVVFVSRSTLGQLRQRIPEFDAKIYIASKPRNSFTRHVMITPAMPPDIVSYVQNAVAKLGSNPSWRKIATRYHIDNQLNKFP